MTLTRTATQLGDYSASSDSFDEFVRPDGSVREQWSHVGPALGELGHDELLVRQADADRLLEADGVSYNTLGSEDPRGRRWSLDPLPAVISSVEWASIEAAIIQRAELLDLVLADIYGPRQLVLSGLLPPEFLFGHPGFLRACDRGITGGLSSGSELGLQGRKSLLTYAVDIAKDASGRNIALSDRAQAPSGAGYALENRIVVSRVFPSLYRDAQVHRLAPFFRSLRTTLRNAAPETSVTRNDPRIVVLTPGPFSETAFEHAFLASYLGYSMVEGSDLTVRAGRVWMRSLGRLEPVDVILRRVDDWYCDPLELRPDSQLGVPGLAQAARSGTVSIVNPLGSGIIESPAMLAFLPEIARRFMGEELRLESVPTWWCGDEKSRQHVLANLPELVIKPTSRGVSTRTVLGRELSLSQLNELRAKIQSQPNEWTAQERVSLSTTPTLSPLGFEARRSVLRAFATVRGDSYAVMPGGLLRVAPNFGDGLISNQTGAVTKDVWVLATEPEQSSGFWLTSGPTVLPSDPVGSMPSRAAENLFWLGRYAERAEDLTRLLRVTYDRRNEFANSTNLEGRACVNILLRALTDVTTTYPGFSRENILEEPEQELLALIVDGNRPGTMAHSVKRLLDTAYAVRDQLSNDTWLVIGSLDRDIQELVESRNGSLSQSTLGRAMHSLLALAGLASENMVRDPGWHFMNAGRRLERSLQLTATLNATLVRKRDTATDSLLFESTLTALESIVTYRRRYRSHAQAETMLDLLLLDVSNPRSLAYQLGQLETDLQAIPRKSDAAVGRLSSAERVLLEAITALRLVDTASLARLNEEGERPQLVAFLAQLHTLLRRCSDAINADHFVPLLPQRTLPVDAR